eukprot:7117168-Alexandrium_andersonii.AAC.1
MRRSRISGLAASGRVRLPSSRDADHQLFVCFSPSSKQVWQQLSNEIYSHDEATISCNGSAYGFRVRLCVRVR